MKRPKSNHHGSDPGAVCSSKIKRRRSDAAPHVVEEEQGNPRGDEDKVREELKDKILELLQKRAESSTMCPSEAPRALHPETWRDLMDVTREVARQLALDGRIEITQKGRAVDPEAPLRGPIRLRLVSRKPPSTSGPPNSN
ncbi:hypothetical protein KC19_2G066900 [Ceratodon purpureus]|uniref:DUF3253 domain-containing protein n=1 Tax=Ceratodon purpureus TaxID=3225 RepID=A0A8T0IUT3_CERPU|nr:hypothetical protein KC19_2G066900 [Ceratodon purpureus]